jgi:predicted amidohydrolase YtcJ
MALAGPQTKIIDLQGKRVLPGLIDNHCHIIRGGLNFNLELRWDGVRSLADAMAMLKAQVAITPAPQWVRVVGGFTEHQFAEKRLPTIEELNAVAPDTPVFILHLYDRALLNGAALRAVGYTKDTPEPPGGEILRDGAGNRPACCWPSRTPRSCTRRWPRARSCRWNTRSTRRATSCAS